MYLMMPSAKIAQMGLLCQEGAARALDKKYLQMKSPPETLVHNSNNFTEMVLIFSSTKIDQKVQLG